MTPQILRPTLALIALALSFGLAGCTSENDSTPTAAPHLTRSPDTAPSDLSAAETDLRSVVSAVENYAGQHDGQLPEDIAEIEDMIGARGGLSETSSLSTYKIATREQFIGAPDDGIREVFTICVETGEVAFASYDSATQEYTSGTGLCADR